MNIALDLDGTLVNFGNGPIEVNQGLIDQAVHPGDVVHIVTNQGGIPLGLRSPENLAERLAAAWRAIEARGAVVGKIAACVYHPKADSRCLVWTAAQVSQMAVRLNTRVSLFAQSRDIMGRPTEVWMQSGVDVFTSELFRKPSGLMLKHVGGEVMFGDGDDDEGEAAAAGVPFTRVSRFTGG